MSDLPTYARAENVVATEVEGTIILLNTQSWVYLEFDKIGSVIWGLMEQPITLPALVSALTERFEVEQSRCEAETASFLDEMMKQGVITATEV